MRYHLSLLLVCISLSLFLTGCNGAREADETAYIIAIGIDSTAEKDMFNVTYQIAVPRALGGDSGGDPKEATAIITVKAPSLAEARNLLKTQLARFPNLSHNKVFVLGEEIARNGTSGLVTSIQRFREFRGSSYIVVVQNRTAEEFINGITPVIELLPSKYLETMMLTDAESGYYIQSFLHEFYTRLKSQSGSPYATLVALEKRKGEDSPSGSRIPGERSKEYYAGNLPINSAGTPTTFAGIAMFSGDRMVGMLTTEETRMFSLVKGESFRTFLVVSDPLVPDKSINLNIRPGRSPRIDTSRRDSQVTLKINLLIEAEITAIPSGQNYEKAENRQILEDFIARLLERDIMKMIRKTQALKSDVAGLGYRVRPLYSDTREWWQQDWEQMYSEAEIDVKVAVAIRRAGLMWQTKLVNPQNNK